jgi:two-component system cell cycle response regulator DivK
MTTILIIEDTPINMKLTKFLLNNAGYQVLEAIDATAGLELAHNEQPDLILMDIQLPGMDGLEAVQRLKQDKATAKIKVLALTAFAMKGDEEKMLRAGFDGYIAKPTHHHILLNKIKETLTAIA